LKPEFSGFAGFKLLGLNMCSRARLKREAKNVLARVGRAEERSQNVLAQVGRAEERSQKRPGSGAGRLLLVRLKLTRYRSDISSTFPPRSSLPLKTPSCGMFLAFSLQPSSKFTLGYFPFTT